MANVNNKLMASTHERSKNCKLLRHVR